MIESYYICICLCICIFYCICICISNSYCQTQWSGPWAGVAITQRWQSRNMWHLQIYHFHIFSDYHFHIFSDLPFSYLFRFTIFISFSGVPTFDKQQTSIIAKNIPNWIVNCIYCQCFEFDVKCRNNSWYTTRSQRGQENSSGTFRNFHFSRTFRHFHFQELKTLATCRRLCWEQLNWYRPGNL